LGRFDLDPTNNQTAHPKLKTKEFMSLVGPDKPLASYTQLPQVVSAGNTVYYCTNETGPVEAGKLVAVIFFQAFWQYLEVLRGNNEISSTLTAQIKEKERMQQSAQAYLVEPEASFLVLPLGLLLERPSVDFYAIAGKLFPKDVERDEAVKKLVEATKNNHERAAVRVGNLYQKALTDLKARGGKFGNIKVPSELKIAVKLAENPVAVAA
jgi:hypothetical protein